MKEIKIGVFPLGYENVELVGTIDQGGGSFTFLPDKTSKPRIRVDIDYDRWDQCLATLLHETQEFLMLRMDIGYEHVRKTNGDVANRIFVMNHSQFGEVCSRQAMFLSGALPALAKVFNQHKTKRK